MTTDPQKKSEFLEVGKKIYLDLINSYHKTVVSDDETYGEIEDNRATYAYFAEMSFAAAEAFVAQFRGEL